MLYRLDNLSVDTGRNLHETLGRYTGHMTLKPADAFGTMAADYDVIARLGMPVYDEQLDAIESCLLDGLTTVLELGCGTGALTSRLVRRYPDAQITAIDAAQEMLDIARGRLQANGEAKRVSFRTELFEDLTLEKQSHELIAANMSLHHVADKQPFYSMLRQALQQGGLLVFGDELQVTLPHIEERYWSAWLAFARQPGHLNEKQVAEIIRHTEELDHYETLPRQLELLTKAGFTRVDCTWRKLNYAVFVAQA